MKERYSGGGGECRLIIMCIHIYNVCVCIYMYCVCMCIDITRVYVHRCVFVCVYRELVVRWRVKVEFER
jgi:hypothetical protein